MDWDEVFHNPKYLKPSKLEIKLRKAEDRFMVKFLKSFRTKVRYVGKHKTAPWNP